MTPRDTIIEVFQNRGAQYVDPAIVQPANVLLDVYGEDLRSRAFIVDDHKTNSFCLRPDFTVPLALARLEAQDFDTDAYCYAGPVFRRDKADATQPREVYQAGFELYKNGIEADCFALETCLLALKRVDIADTKIRIGDLGILSAVLEAMDIPQGWRDRLQRHIWRPVHFSQFLNEYGYSINKADENRNAFLKSFARLDNRNATQAVQHILSLFNTPHQGSRSLADIAERFIALSREAQHKPLHASSVNLIKDVIALRCPADEAVDHLSKLTNAAGVDIRTTLETFAQRLKSLPANCTFDAGFGRNLEYYDGFVFEIHADTVLLAGGGRYNRLFAMLKPDAQAITGVGGAIRLQDVQKVLDS